MQKIILFLFIIFVIFPVFSEENQQKNLAEENTKRINEIEERLDTIEKKTLVDRINFSMDVRMTLNNYIYRDKSSDSTKKLGLLRDDGETFGLWNMRGRLKMRALLGDNFMLTAWLSMYKQFIESAPGRYDLEDISPGYDQSRGYYPSNSMIYMERLYLDWFVTKWLSFSLGRVSSVDGVPADLKYDTVPLGTFPMPLTSAPEDLIFFTLNLKELINLNNSYLRLWYVPIQFLSRNISNNLFVGYGDHLQNSVGFFLDVEIPKVNTANLYLAFIANPEFKSSPIQQDINGDGKNEDLYTSNYLGAFYSLYLGFYAKKPVGFPVSFFASINNIFFMTPSRTDSDPNRGFVGMPIDEKTGLSTPLVTLLGNDLKGKTLYAWQAYFLMQYDTPLKMFDNTLKIGAEASISNRYYFLAYSPETTGLNEFQLRGLHAEGFIIIPIHRKANIRLGYIFQHHTNTMDILAPIGSGIPDISEYIHNFNAMLNIYF